MYKNFKIKSPFFEIGTKAFLYGKSVLKLALAADKIAKKHSVHIIFDPQYTDIPEVAKKTKHLLVFAQHMDSIAVGSGYGSVLPEAIKAAGAAGTVLNHSEKPISLSELSRSIKRADDIGLATMVCASTIEEVGTVARLSPNIIVAEEPDLIGTGKTSSLDYIKRVIETAGKINPEIHILIGGGVNSDKDVYKIIKSGASATGSSSSICNATEPAEMLEKMIEAMLQAWNERKNNLI